jgi:GT2 family glycosyltransferase
MRILAHIHTFNDVDVIEQLLDALRRQTRPLDAVLLVDNASSDGTSDKAFSENITIVRNSHNLGPSGAIRIGFAHALEQRFDWTWILDADSVPEPDALEKLIAFFERLSLGEREQVCFLNCFPLTVTGEVKQHPLSFVKAGIEVRPLERVREFTQCDFTLWSGSLYRMAAVRRIGMPTADYVADVGECEYGYRARQLGFTSYIVHRGVIHHDVGRNPGAVTSLYRFGPIRLTSYELSPWRTYYSVRNMIYFWLYEYKPRRLTPAVRWVGWRVATLTLNFVRAPRNHGGQVVACMRGIWHGVLGNMSARY